MSIEQIEDQIRQLPADELARLTQDGATLSIGRPLQEHREPARQGGTSVGRPVDVDGKAGAVAHETHEGRKVVR